MSTAGPTISLRLGAAIAAGVPMLVLVSMGPVAALTGPASVAVWGFSALVGFFMALAFAELASSYPHVNGGVAVVAAQVLRPFSALLGRVGQWSYWLGWSPALAVNALLIGVYGQRLLAPNTPQWTAVLLATVVLAGSVAVNHLGMTASGRAQAVLLNCVVVVVALLFAGAILRGSTDTGRLTPFAPPGGWGSAGGWLAVSGALFLAGWSAYGSELALAYATRYRRGARDAVRVLAAVALAGVVVFVGIPLLTVVTVGAQTAQGDPAVVFAALSERAVAGAGTVVLAVLVLALLLGLNMIAVGSSWTLHQMAATGDAPRFLGRLNRHGMPGNALRFDLAVNVGLLLVITALAGGRTAGVPVALLAAANVGYFVSMCIALAASWYNHRHGTVRGPVRLRAGLARTVPLLIGLNLVLLGAAGQVWGWRNVVVGAAVLAAATVLARAGSRRAAPARAPVAATGPPGCWIAASEAARSAHPSTRGQPEQGAS